VFILHALAKGGMSTIMNQMSFATGPWHASPMPNGEWAIESQDWAICLVADGIASDRVIGVTPASNITASNAQLIAAAPDMYDALCCVLENALETNCYAPTQSNSSPLAKVMDALMKARKPNKEP
jgi:hypothetical protein